jgi:hypothetical protein
VSLPGSFSVTGTFQGLDVDLLCDESTSADLFVRYWASSLGNISGAISCGNEAGERVTVSFIGPSEGEWTTTEDGMSWSYEDGTGHYLSYDSDSTAWELAITTYTFVDTTTIEMDGTLSGTWAGTVAADLQGSFATEIACSGGC